jgi:hypothetical protein
MGHIYVVRTLALITGFYVVLCVGLEALGIVIFYAIEAHTSHSLYHAKHFSSVSYALDTVRELTNRMMPLDPLLICIQPFATFTWLLYRAYFWNRRALRALAHPAIPGVPVSPPGVWPPQPRME